MCAGRWKPHAPTTYSTALTGPRAAIHAISSKVELRVRVLYFYFLFFIFYFLFLFLFLFFIFFRHTKIFVPQKMFSIFVYNLFAILLGRLLCRVREAPVMRVERERVSQ